jgi:hypothetical protein
MLNQKSSGDEDQQEYSNRQRHEMMQFTDGGLDQAGSSEEDDDIDCEGMDGEPSAIEPEQQYD